MLTYHGFFQLLSLISGGLDLLQLLGKQVEEHHQDGHCRQANQIILDTLDKGLVDHLLYLCRDALQLNELLFHTLHAHL